VERLPAVRQRNAMFLPPDYQVTADPNAYGRAIEATS